MNQFKYTCLHVYQKQRFNDHQRYILWPTLLTNFPANGPCFNCIDETFRWTNNLLALYCTYFKQKGILKCIRYLLNSVFTLYWHILSNITTVLVIWIVCTLHCITITKTSAVECSSRMQKVGWLNPSRDRHES